MPKIYKNGTMYQNSSSVTTVEYVDIANETFENIKAKLEEKSKLVIGTIAGTGLMYCSSYDDEAIRFYSFSYELFTMVVKRNTGEVEINSSYYWESISNRKHEITDEEEAAEDYRMYPTVGAARDYIKSKLPNGDGTSITTNSEGKLTVAYTIYKSTVDPAYTDGKDGDIWVKYTEA